jgi:hypothetical protein
MIANGINDRIRDDLGKVVAAPAIAASGATGE